VIPSALLSKLMAKYILANNELAHTPTRWPLICEALSEYASSIKDSEGNKS